MWVCRPEVEGAARRLRRHGVCAVTGRFGNFITDETEKWSK